MQTLVLVNFGQGVDLIQQKDLFDMDDRIWENDYISVPEEKLKK